LTTSEQNYNRNVNGQSLFDNLGIISVLLHGEYSAVHNMKMDW